MRNLILGLTMLLLLPMPSGAQETKIEGFNEPQFRLRGPEIPLYFVVESFFRAMSDLSQKWDDSYEFFLKEHMNVDPGSAAASAILDAVQAAEPILRIKTINMDLVEDEQAFGAYQYTALKSKALRLREIYLDLVSKLDDEGYSHDKLQAFLNREFRSGMSITVVGTTFEGSVGEAVKAFEDPDFDKGDSLIFRNH